MNVKWYFIGCIITDVINIFMRQKMIIPPSINAILSAMLNPKRPIKIKQQELAWQLWSHYFALGCLADNSLDVQ